MPTLENISQLLGLNIEPWMVGIVILVLALLPMLAAVRRWVRSRQPNAQDAKAAPNPSSTSPDDVKKAFKSRQELLQATAVPTSATLPYANSLILLMGPEGSGKANLLTHLNPNVKPDGPDSAGCVWWKLSDDTVALDVNGAYLLAQDDSADSDGWDAVLQALVDTRYRRPIDSVILAWSVEEFLNDDHNAALSLRAELTRQRLLTLSKTLGMRVPLYILLTCSDALPGFRELCEVVQPGSSVDAKPDSPPDPWYPVTPLPQDWIDSAVGWSNPNQLEAAYQSQWSDDIIAAILSRLSALQDALPFRPSDLVIVNRADVGTPSRLWNDGLVRFQEAVRDLESPLRVLLDALMMHSGITGDFFLRGVYLVGDSGASSHLAPQSSSSQPAAAPTLNKIAFVNQVVLSKIIPETKLAQPQAEPWQSANVWFRRVQAICVVVVLASLALLIAEGVHIHRATSSYNDHIQPVLAQTHQEGAWSSEANTASATEAMAVCPELEPWLDITSDAPTEQDKPVHTSAHHPTGTQESIHQESQRIGEAMKAVLETPWRRLYIPASWPGITDRQWQTGVRDAYRARIIRRFRRRIDGRHCQLIARPKSPTDDPRGAFQAYLDQIRDTTGLGEAYDTLNTSPTVQLLGTMFGQLYSSTPPDVLAQHLEPFLEKAGVGSAEPRVVKGARLQRALRANVLDRSQRLWDATLLNPINQPIQRVDQALANIQRLSAHGKLTVADGDKDNQETDQAAAPTDLPNLSESVVELTRAVEALRVSLDDPNHSWLGAPAYSPNAQEKDLLAQVTSMELLGPEVENQIMAQSDVAFERARRSLKHEAPLVGALFATRGGQPQLKFSPNMIALETALKTLNATQCAFKKPPKPNGKRIKWNPDKLKETLGLLQTRGAAALAADLNADIKKVLSDYATESNAPCVRTALFNSIVQTKQDYCSLRKSVDQADACIKEGVDQLKNLNESKEVLIEILDELDFRVLDDSTTSNAYQKLSNEFLTVLVAQVGGLAKELKARLPEYTPTAPKGWTGEPLLLEVMYKKKSADAAKAYLKDKLVAAQQISEQAAPLLPLFERSDLYGNIADANVRRAYETLEQLQLELEIYNGQDKQDSTIAQLEQFIVVELNTITPDNCLENTQPSSLPDDHFSNQLDGVLRSIRADCSRQARHELKARYASMQGYFNNHLKNRYPFAAWTPTVQTISPIVLPGMFQHMDRDDELDASRDNVSPNHNINRVAAIARSGIAETTELRASYSAIAGWAASMRAARAFLEPMLTANAQATTDMSGATNAASDLKGRPITIQVGFRARGGEQGANQFLGWSLGTDVDSVRLSDGNPASLTWTVGSPLTLALTLAKDGPNLLRAHNPPYYSLPLERTVDTARLTSRDSWTNAWSLIQMLQASRNACTSPGGGPYILERTIALEAKASPDDLTRQAHPAVSLDVMTRAPKTNIMLPLVLPCFPTSAPDL